MADDTRESLRALLKAANLRATEARIAVLGHLRAQSSPVSHPEMCEALADQGWDRATLYRNLVDLTTAGLFRRRSLGDHVYRYEVSRHDDAHGDDDHPHFLCTSCGEVACLPEVEVARPRGDVPRALSAGAFQVQYRGRCDACAD